jgi:hypothetical protein
MERSGARSEHIMTDSDLGVLKTYGSRSGSGSGNILFVFSIQARLLDNDIKEIKTVEQKVFEAVLIDLFKIKVQIQQLECTCTVPRYLHRQDPLSCPGEQLIWRPIVVSTVDVRQVMDQLEGSIQAFRKWFFSDNKKKFGAKSF